MNDKDFDKIFSKGLNEEPKKTYDERDWENLAQRLDAHDAKNVVSPQSGVPKWKKSLWLAPLLLLLLGVNGWSLLKTNEAENQNETLLNELKSLKTIIEHQNKQTEIKTIIQRDTVIIYKYLPSTSSFFEKSKVNSTSDLSQINSQLLRQTPSVFLPNSMLLEDKNKVLIKTENIQIVDNQLFNKKNESDLNKANPENNTLTMPPNLLLNDFLPIKNERLLKSLKSQKEVTPPQLSALKYPVSIIKPMPSNRFFIGPSGGLIYYHSAWLNKDNVEVFRNEKSYQVGLKMEYALSNHWRVVLGGDYCPFNFQIYWQDSRYNLPQPTAYFTNNPNIKFTSVKANQSIVQASLGIKHYFTGNRFRPYIGGGYATMRILPFQAEYEYTEWNKIVYTKPFQNTVTINNLLILNGGLEYRLNARLFAQIDVFYSKDVNKTHKTYDLFGLKGTLLFGFQ